MLTVKTDIEVDSRLQTTTQPRGIATPRDEAHRHAATSANATTKTGKGIGTEIITLVGPAIMTRETPAPITMMPGDPVSPTTT